MPKVRVKRKRPEPVWKSIQPLMNKQDNSDRTLHLIFPTKRPPIEAIKELHSKIVGVTVPRQNTARYCFLTFITTEDADEVKKALDGQMYKSKGRLRVTHKDPMKQAPQKKIPESTSSDKNESSNQSSADSESKSD